MKRTLLLTAALLACALPLSARDKMPIAVLDLQPKGVSKVLAGAVTDIIRSEMVKTGLFTVLERGQMKEILKEQEFQMTGCTDSACAVQVGKILSAKQILLGEMNKVGTNYLITVRIVDVEKGASEFAASERAVNEDMLEKAGTDITRKLAENIVEGNKDFFIEKKTMKGYYLRSIVPGWGQMYAGNNIKGAVFMAAFAGSIGFMGYSYYNYQNRKSAYEDQMPPQALIDQKYNDYEKASKQNIFAGITLTAIYMLHWIDVIYFSKPDFGTTRSGVLLQEKANNLLCIETFPYSNFEKEYRYTVSYQIRF
jgi:TolB-like protein